MIHGSWYFGSRCLRHFGRRLAGAAARSRQRPGRGPPAVRRRGGAGDPHGGEGGALRAGAGAAERNPLGHNSCTWQKRHWIDHLIVLFEKVDQMKKRSQKCSGHFFDFLIPFFLDPMILIGSKRSTPSFHMAMRSTIFFANESPETVSFSKRLARLCWKIMEFTGKSSESSTSQVKWPLQFGVRACTAVLQTTRGANKLSRIRFVWKKNSKDSYLT